MDTVNAIIASPYTALVVCLLFGGAAMSGKFSQSAAQFCLLVAALVGIMGIVKSSAEQPRLMFGGILMLIGFCLLISHWIKPPQLIAPPSPPPPPPFVDKPKERPPKDVPKGDKGTSPLTTPKPNLRERGLRLSAEITALIQKREQKAPADLVHPPNFGVGGKMQQDNTPPYMRETLTLFIGQFEGSIVDLHDEFSARGLQESTLEAVIGHLPEMFGNIHAMIQKVADSIRKLALLTPPDSLYEGVPDARLYQMAIDEANNSERRAKAAFDKLSGFMNPNATREFFYAEFRECCLNQIEYLRVELIKRIGPTAIDPDEMSYFNGEQIGITEMEPNASISAVLDYVPKFRELAEKLKH